jgi:predicted PurR-regulated permease PerM
LVTAFKPEGVRNVQNRIIKLFIIINLFLLSVIMLGKMHFIHKLAGATIESFLIPLLIAALLFYILRPLNNIFIKRGLSSGKASLLTLTICTFILSGLISHFSKYAYDEFQGLIKEFLKIINDERKMDGFISLINRFIDVNEIYTLIALAVKSYILQIARGFMRVAGYFMDTFSIVFLIIITVFYMLKDGHKFKEHITKLIPEKYRKIINEIMSESDTILSHYVIGQAKVALSLAVMVFLGYKIVGIPNALLLSVITFTLAFIPFIGFFISMIIPTVIALDMGFYIFLKLIVLFIIVQTLKGRVVVPAIMAKTMDIHPLTDIFLVMAAIAVGGPFAAFAVVPLYAVIKNAVRKLK